MQKAHEESRCETSDTSVAVNFWSRASPPSRRASRASRSPVSGYLRVLGEQLGLDETTLPSRRLASVALWSTTKAALVRDFAERVLNGEVPPNVPTAEPFSQWMAERLLDPEELAAWERERGERK
jgi:hypothetical protein